MAVAAVTGRVQDDAVGMVSLASEASALPLASSRNRPDAGRTWSRDLISNGAYWRELTEAEKKIDFAEMERNEGRALTGSRVRFGLILAAQMAAYIAWAKRPSFTSAATKRVPLFLADEVGDEFARLFARAWWDGTNEFQKMMRRHDRERGIDPRDAAPEVVLDAASVRRLFANARQLAVDVVRGISVRLMPVFESAFDPSGTKLKTDQQIEDEIRSVYFGKGGYLEEAPARLEGADLLSLAAFPRGEFTVRLRAMKVADEVQREKFLRTRVPFTKWIKQTAEQIRNEGSTPPQLKTDKAARYLQTERTRYFSHGVIAGAQNDPEVVQLQFSALRSSKDVCASFDGTVLPKGDPRWAIMTPPLHHGCKCGVFPVTRDERMKRTPASEMRDLPWEDIPAGYGTYDPEAIKRSRVLEIVPPSGVRQSRAIAGARGRR